MSRVSGKREGMREERGVQLGRGNCQGTLEIVPQEAQMGPQK